MRGAREPPDASFSVVLGGRSPPGSAAGPAPCEGAGLAGVEAAPVDVPCVPGPAEAPVGVSGGWPLDAPGRARAIGRRARRDDPLDPTARTAAQLAPPVGAELAAKLSPPQPDPITEARAGASLEDVLPALVRRIAWSGDGRRGCVRLVFGAGELAGGTLVVHAEEGRVRVELDAPPGSDPRAWRDRIASRLEARGIAVDGIVVT